MQVATHRELFEALYFSIRLPCLNAGGGGDGEQTWPHGVRNNLDKPDLIEVRANQSTQVLVTTADSCFPAAGGMAAVGEAEPAYKALGGDLQVFEGVWHHGWVLPTREQINRFFCDALGDGFSGGWKSVGCSNKTELDVSHENPVSQRHLPPLFSRPLFARFAPSFRRSFAVSGFLAPRRRERAKNGVKWGKFGGRNARETAVAK